MIARYGPVVVLAAAAALLVGSVLALVDDRAGPATATGGPTAVSVRDFRFEPADLSVTVGDTVTWTNDDAFAHTVTATDGATFDSGDLEGGATFEQVFDEAGTVEYTCDLHPNMDATVTVEGP